MKRLISLFFFFTLFSSGLGVCAQNNGYKLYQIKSGDTFWSVTKQYLKDHGVSTPTDAQINKQAEILATFNGYKTARECSEKCFYHSGSTIKLPTEGYLVDTKSDVSSENATMSEFSAMASLLLIGDLMRGIIGAEAKGAPVQLTYTTKQGDTSYKLAREILMENNPQERPSNTDIYVLVKKIAKENNLTVKGNGQFLELENVIKTPGSVILLPYGYTYSKADKKSQPATSSTNSVTTNAPTVTTSSVSTSQTSNKTPVTQHANPTTPVSKPTTAPASTQNPTATPQKQTNTPKPTVTTPQASVTQSQPSVASKAMTLKQMITCPMGVLSAEDPTIDRKTIENQLAAVDSSWEVLTNAGGQVHANKYDMTYEGHKIDAYCDFIYKNNSKGRLQSNYIFFFEKEKEATEFYQSLLSQMKSEGATVIEEKFESSHHHSTNLTCYGLHVTVRRLKAPTKYKYQVRINVDY